jgi:hypothetical protein
LFPRWRDGTRSVPSICWRGERQRRDHGSGGPAAERLIKSDITTEDLVADGVVDIRLAQVIVSYRQAQIMRLQGLPVDRSTLAGWVGAAAAEIKPVYLRVKDIVLGSAKIVVDETRAPVSVLPGEAPHPSRMRRYGLQHLRHREPRSADERRAIRQTETRPLVEALKTWLENRLISASDKRTVAEAFRYGFNHWYGLVRLTVLSFPFVLRCIYRGRQPRRRSICPSRYYRRVGHLRKRRRPPIAFSSDDTGNILRPLRL